MLEAHIQIDDELAAKGYKRALKGKAIRDIAKFYSNYLIVIWVVVAVADGLMGAGHLIFPHLVVIFGLWIAAIFLGYNQWTKQVAAIKGWSFYAKLDEQGVIITRSENERLNWNFYKNYKEYDDYLEIESSQGEITFLPKTPELFEVVEFTKQKISQK
ncbi:MAG TPA: hypothetical protein VK892_10990 [Pyrinomonadaceae bacterium]|nr:hypothetical protein [Pyrinomonadaceae bacterium]